MGTKKTHSHIVFELNQNQCDYVLNSNLKKLRFSELTRMAQPLNLPSGAEALA